MNPFFPKYYYRLVGKGYFNDMRASCIVLKKIALPIHVKCTLSDL